MQQMPVQTSITAYGRRQHEHMVQVGHHANTLHQYLLHVILRLKNTPPLFEPDQTVQPTSYAKQPTFVDPPSVVVRYGKEKHQGACRHTTRIFGNLHWEAH